MKTILKAGIAVIGTALAGCTLLPATSADNGSDIDQAKVAAINTQAHYRGVDVFWLNYPQKSGANASP